MFPVIRCFPYEVVVHTGFFAYFKVNTPNPYFQLFSYVDVPCSDISCGIGVVNDYRLALLQRLFAQLHALRWCLQCVVVYTDVILEICLPHCGFTATGRSNKQHKLLISIRQLIFITLGTLHYKLVLF